MSPLVKKVTLVRIFQYLTIVWFVVTIAIFVIIIVDKYPLYISLDSQGVRNFFIIFEDPIKLTTGLVALLVILLTTKRMEQTSRQIEAIDSNNRFNNFYKHREQFEKDYIKFNFIQKLHGYEEYHHNNRMIPQGNILVKIGGEIKTKARWFYTIFYYTAPNKFRDEFNNETINCIEKIQSFLSHLAKVSSLNTQIDFEKISIEKLGELINLFPSAVILIMNHMAKIDNVELKIKGKTEKDFGRFVKLNMVYWSFVLFKDTLDYEGKDTTDIYYFIVDYSLIRVEKGLYCAI